MTRADRSEAIEGLEVQRRMNADDPWASNEAARRNELRSAGKRTLGENLAATLELSEALLQVEPPRLKR